MVLISLSERGVKMIKVAFCDDESKILEDLSQKVFSKFEENNCEIDLYTTENSMELLEYLKTNTVDILFLDIDMPMLSGMDIAETLLNSEINTLLVFVTGQDALVYKSFKYHPFGFIRKTYFDEEISSVVKGLIEELHKNADTFSFKTNDSVNRVKIKDILYFESESNYLNLHTNSFVYKFRSTLSAIEKELSVKGFIRTHKGFLVNQEHIFSVKSDTVILDNNDILPIGRTNRDVIKARIMRYMR